MFLGNPPEAGEKKNKTARFPIFLAARRYYKGNRSASTGHHTSLGHYVIDPAKRLKLVVPDLAGFKLQAYVAVTVQKVRFPTASQTLLS